MFLSQVAIGSGKGRMLLFDFRQQKVIHAYRGFTGAIRQLMCHPSKPFVVSVGLDRFVRLHHLDRQTPFHKAYLKSRLNAVLIRQDFNIDTDNAEELTVETIGNEKDSFWSEMEVIKEHGLTETEMPEKQLIDSENNDIGLKNKGSQRKRRKAVS